MKAMVRILLRDPDWDTLTRQARYLPDELAKVLHLTLRTLEREIDRRFHTSVGTWLKPQRLREAVRLGRVGCSIKEIAPLVGYKSSAAFCHAFKAATGLSFAAFLKSSELQRRLSDLLLAPESTTSREQREWNDGTVINRYVGSTSPGNDCREISIPRR